MSSVAGDNGGSNSTAVVIPPFTIKSSGQNTNITNDWYDLDDLFQDDFFPKELDFAGLFDDEQLRKYNTDMDNILEGEMSDIGDDNVDSGNRVILIPPTMPRGVTSEVAAPATVEPKKGESSSSSRRKAAPKAATPTVAKTGVKRGSKAVQEEVDDDNEDGDLTEEQRIERRDRNREHAKKSRIRKRVLLDTLQDQLKALRAQNAQLRRVVADRLPGELAARVLLECTTEESTLLAGCSSSGPASSEDEGAPKPSALTVNIASGMMSSKVAKAKSSGGSSAVGASSTGKKVLMESDYRLMSSLVTTQQNFVLSDPSLPDNPIVYASDGFCRLSGYRRQDILGRNCRFLQGPGTDQAAVNVIRQGVADRKDVSVCLLNYRADGSPFWNQFFLGALKDAVGNIVNYVGVQCEVNALPIAEMKDRVKKLPLPDA